MKLVFLIVLCILKTLETPGGAQGSLHKLRGNDGNTIEVVLPCNLGGIGIAWWMYLFAKYNAAYVINVKHLVLSKNRQYKMNVEITLSSKHSEL